MIALVVITFVALLPGDQGRPTLIGWDKLDHIASFAALTLLARAGWPDRRRWVPAAALFAYGVGIELVQGSDLVGRTASLADLAANALGVGLGLALAFGLGRAARILTWLPLRR